MEYPSSLFHTFKKGHGRARISHALLTLRSKALSADKSSAPDWPATLPKTELSRLISSYPFSERGESRSFSDTLRIIRAERTMGETQQSIRLMIALPPYLLPLHWILYHFFLHTRFYCCRIRIAVWEMRYLPTLYSQVVAIDIGLIIHMNAY